MSASKGRPIDEKRATMAQFVNRERDTADEAARMYGGCDDPMHPFMPAGDGQQFRSWVDFVDRVARPLVENDGDDHAVEQAAMALYRQASPYFICLALYMASNAAHYNGRRR